MKEPTEETKELESASLNIDESRQCAGTIIKQMHFLCHEKPLLCFSNEKRFVKAKNILKKNKFIDRNCEKSTKKVL